MNDEIEDILKRAPLAAPSQRLDQRVESLFKNAAQSRAPKTQLIRWRSVCAVVALAACLVVALVVGHPRPDRRPAGEVTVIHLEAQGQLRDLLIKPATQSSVPLFPSDVTSP